MTFEFYLTVNMTNRLLTDFHTAQGFHLFVIHSNLAPIEEPRN